jgi:hypothetical protein
MGFAVAGIGAAVGGMISANASENAANTEANAARNATGVQLGIYNDEKANAAPWLQSGQAALGTLNADMPSLTTPFSMQDFQQSPGYQFQLSQGEQAMQRSAAASGILNSVGTEQGLNNYAQGSANTDYQQALQNYMGQNQQTYNMLSGMSGQGLSAASLTNTAAQNAGNNVSSNIIGAANASAAGQVGTANAITGGISSLANGYMNKNAMSNVFGNQNPGSMNGPLLNSTQGANSAMYDNMPQLSPNSSTFGSLTD